MNIRTLWITRKSDRDIAPPELLAAWDEYSIDENPKGFKEACDAALAAGGNDVDEFRFITFRVPEDLILKAFEDTVMVVRGLWRRDGDEPPARKEQ